MNSGEGWSSLASCQLYKGRSQTFQTCVCKYICQKNNAAQVLCETNSALTLLLAVWLQHSLTCTRTHKNPAVCSQTSFSRSIFVLWTEQIKVFNSRKWRKYGEQMICVVLQSRRISSLLYRKIKGFFDISVQILCSAEASSLLEWF